MPHHLDGSFAVRWLVCVVALALISGHATAAERQTFEAETAELVGGASRVADNAIPGGYLDSLERAGQAVRLAGLPAASKLAICYASVTNGTISVAVNDQPARKLNVHSSGALTNCVLHAIMALDIPAGATLTIRVATNDVAVNIGRIMIGDGRFVVAISAPATSTTT